MGKRQPWRVGDVFLVPTNDGLAVLGQVVGQEKAVLNSVTCAFFDARVPVDGDFSAELPTHAVFSVLFVTRDLLDSGRWRVIHHAPIAVSREKLPYEHLRGDGFVGAKVIGSGIVNEFLNAFYGLVPWDDWKDPGYLDGLLLSPDRKPRRVVLKK